MEILSTEGLWALLQVIMIDLVLAGANAIVIGLAAAGLPADQRNRAHIVTLAVTSRGLLNVAALAGAALLDRKERA